MKYICYGLHHRQAFQLQKQNLLCCYLLVVLKHVLNISFWRRMMNSAEAYVYRNLELLAFMSYMLQETAPSFQLEQLIKGMIG